MRVQVLTAIHTVDNILCCARGRPQRRAVAGGADRAGGRSVTYVQPVPHSAAGALPPKSACVYWHCGMWREVVLQAPVCSSLVRQ